MPENVIFDREQVWNELLDRVYEQGAPSREAYHELVEDYFNEKINAGELDEDQNISQLIAEFKARWYDLQKEVGA